MSHTLLTVENLKKYFHVKGGTLKAVDDISFEIYKGETFSLVGESGCGKSTTGRTILQLYPPTGGSIYYEDEKISGLPEPQLRAYRKKMQIIFQDPYASLNQRMKILDLIAEPIDIHKMGERKERVISLLDKVGLNSEHAERFPHEFSGGQRQRIGIARALATEPRFIVCDEPISALDVSIQAQVVNLLRSLQDESGLTYLFIAHDLSMVRYISDRVAVMYLGSLVELADSKSLYKTPTHPYTKALLSAIPLPDPRQQQQKKRIILQGEVPGAINPPDGCKFADRCRYVSEVCRIERPHSEEVAKGHSVACHHWKEIN